MLLNICYNCLVYVQVGDMFVYKISRLQLTTEKVAPAPVVAKYVYTLIQALKFTTVERSRNFPVSVTIWLLIIKTKTQLHQLVSTRKSDCQVLLGIKESLKSFSKSDTDCSLDSKRKKLKNRYI